MSVFPTAGGTLPPAHPERAPAVRYCNGCGKLPALANVYPFEMRANPVRCLSWCWACGNDYFRPKNALDHAAAAARSLSGQFQLSVNLWVRRGLEYRYQFDDDF